MSQPRRPPCAPLSPLLPLERCKSATLAKTPQLHAYSTAASNLGSRLEGAGDLVNGALDGEVNVARAVLAELDNEPPDEAPVNLRLQLNVLGACETPKRVMRNRQARLYAPRAETLSLWLFPNSCELLSDAASHQYG